MGKSQQRRPIGLRQLCAIARVLVARDPSMDLADFSEALKCELIRQGWTYPQPLDLLTEAIRRVAPRRVARTSASTAGQTPPASRGLSQAESVAALRQIAARVGARPPIKAMPPVRRLTVHGAERHAALRIVMQAIREQVAQCEEVER